MKKLLVFATLLMVSAGTLFAQDYITKKDATDVKAIVLEVNPDNIVYKLYDHQDGPTYTILKSDIVLITYASGHKEVYNVAPKNDYSELFYDASRQAPEGIQPNMRYKDYKSLYKPRDYTSSMGDRYSPGWNGVASAFIPGLGQAICGEWLPAVGFFVGNIALMSVANTYVALSYVDPYPQWETDIYIALASYVAALALDIYSIVDAVQMSKIKNMYNQDIRRLFAEDVSVNIYPSLMCAPTAKGIQPTAGMTMAITF